MFLIKGLVNKRMSPYVPRVMTRAKEIGPISFLVSNQSVHCSLVIIDLLYFAFDQRIR